MTIPDHDTRLLPPEPGIRCHCNHFTEIQDGAE